MKNLFIILIILTLSTACDQKKPVKKTEEQEQKTDSKVVEVTEKSDKEYKTNSGKIFIIKEDITSASLSKISIKPKGFEFSKDVIQMEESDPFDYALVADVNNDGFDELYIITRGAGSGSYANIYGFASNKDKSVSPIYVPELSDDEFVALFPGYMGHDKFYIEDNKLLRKYPVYKKEDSNDNPTRGEKVLEYNLKMGEASWILEITN